MEHGTIPLDDLAGGFDLQSTVESGQSYTWWRDDDRMFADAPAYGGDAWYYTVLTDRFTGTGTEVVRVRQTDRALEWNASCDAHDHLVHLLRLDDDLAAVEAQVQDATGGDPLVHAAFDAYRGMRLVRDPPFRSLVSFICSAQMRVERIHDMQTTLCRAYGDSVDFDGRTYHAFPTPEQLAAASEAELRERKLGYRAPYVQQTAELVASGEAAPEDACGLPYEDARESLTRFVGVGDKVADCVLLFSLGYLEAVPLDTWIRRTIAEHYPTCDRGNYAETSRAIREQFGGQYAGYAQTYVFHYLRSRGQVEV